MVKLVMVRLLHTFHPALQLWQTVIYSDVRGESDSVEQIVCEPGLVVLVLLSVSAGLSCLLAFHNPVGQTNHLPIKALWNISVTG